MTIPTRKSVRLIIYGFASYAGFWIVTTINSYVKEKTTHFVLVGIEWFLILLAVVLFHLAVKESNKEFKRRMDAMERQFKADIQRAMGLLQSQQPITQMQRGPIGRGPINPLQRGPIGLLPSSPNSILGQSLGQSLGQMQPSEPSDKIIKELNKLDKQRTKESFKNGNN